MVPVILLKKAWTCRSINIKMKHDNVIAKPKFIGLWNYTILGTKINSDQDTKIFIHFYFILNFLGGWPFIIFKGPSVYTMHKKTNTKKIIITIYET